MNQWLKGGEPQTDGLFGNKVHFSISQATGFLPRGPEGRGQEGAWLACDKSGPLKTSQAGGRSGRDLRHQASLCTCGRKGVCILGRGAACTFESVSVFKDEATKHSPMF